MNWQKAKGNKTFNDPCIIQVYIWTLYIIFKNLDTHLRKIKVRKGEKNEIL